MMQSVAISTEHMYTFLLQPSTCFHVRHRDALAFTELTVW